MEKSVKELQSPWNWDLDNDLVLKFDENKENFVGIQDQPVKAVVYPATLVYIYTVQNNLKKACDEVRKTVENFQSLNLTKLEQEKVSKAVLVHIVRATLYHYYTAIGKPEEAEKNLKAVPELELEQINDEIKGTLYACKSIAWSVFFDAPKDFALSFMKQALRSNPSCYHWHLLMAKKLRTIRRIKSLSQPNNEEIKHFLKAYELSNGNDYVGAFVAQMYWEKKDFEIAKKLCIKIYDSNLQSVGIKLRLTLIFLRSRDFERAKSCLDFVQSVCPDNTMFLHYKAMYFEKQSNCELAALYYSESAKLGNYKAEIKFGQIMTKINNYDFFKHINKMIEKYKDPNTKQLLLLNLAIQYYFDKKDLINALIFFKKAIEINPKHPQLKSFYYSDNNKNINIFDFLNDKLLTDCTKTYPKVPEEIREDYKVLKSFLKTNNDCNLVQNMKKMKIKN